MDYGKLVIKLKTLNKKYVRNMNEHELLREMKRIITTRKHFLSYINNHVASLYLSELFNKGDQTGSPIYYDHWCDESLGSQRDAHIGYKYYEYYNYIKQSEEKLKLLRTTLKNVRKEKVDNANP